MEDSYLRFRITPPIIGSLFDDIEHKTLSPLSCLREFDNHWRVEFDLPMVGKKDIKVSFDGNYVNVEAKLKQKYSEEKLGTITKFEYFKKSISLPEKIDSKKATAKFQKGRLEIKIPKRTAGNLIKIN
ncbi:MAG: Hsp20/alpha crystallin family protein [Nitrosopumilus sp.]|uniref:Hsp20/alpha crystallin family protein n=1 Tax=Nitrosopumilus sp. TaxID=2024843 RepID=UPI00246AB009|nr:Hsp20/alpha crystallin family protein [Nitrosopumilus sp.]MDH5431529.1 Hsp20/alpha crystallin family protein [Nitrosopumilus sp.]MDH5697244.1 Hsp20/alpha crystallin family protein [Nitrosopumilus sp.]